MSDPDNPDNVILLYTGRSHPKTDEVSTVLNPDNDNDSWNREHVWPKSHGFPSQGQLAHTDIHHLRPNALLARWGQLRAARCGQG